MDLRAPERLVGVDVPDAGDRALVEERRLDRRLPLLQARRQRRRREGGAERLLAEPRIEVRVELVRLEQQPGAEAADVAIGDVRAVVEADDGADVPLVAARVLQEAPG